MRKKGVLRGAKISNRHLTFTKEAAPIIVFAKQQSEVSKVVLGVIIHLGAGPRRLKVTRAQAGLKVMVRGFNSQQTLFVYTSDTEATERKLREYWESIQ